MLSVLTGRAESGSISPGDRLENTPYIRLQTIKVQRRFRLTSSSEVKRVRRFGKSYAHPLIVLIALPNEDGKLRFSISAGRVVGNAVQRNRAKRVIREVVRRMIPKILPGWDILLLARQPMREASFDQTQDALMQLLHRAHLIVSANEC